MTTADTIDTALKVIYIDPLVEDAVCDFKSAKQRWQVALGDELIHPYIQKLNEEIFSDEPYLVPANGTEWVDDRLGDMATQLLDKVRVHGWAVVQFYTQEPLWRVFSVDEMQKWIYDKNGEIIGANFSLTTHTGTATQVCVWDYKQCYLMKWKEGDGKEEFAYPDISQALWTNATITRQIRNQLDCMGSKPEFPWVTYGDSVTQNQRTAILNAIDDSSITNGIGATAGAVANIQMIPHTLYDELGELLDQKSRRFAGLTRLPYAFYNGERESQGLGEKGELIVEMKIDKRKQHIFNKIKPILRALYLERYNITLTEIEMDMNELEEDQPTSSTSPSEGDNLDVEEIQDE